MFLIDEFGIGLDFELGGVLVEIFFEEFYYREVFGIIIMYYFNLKILVNELLYVINVNMMFDEKLLELMYKFVLG